MKISIKELRQIILESESYKKMLSKNHEFGEPWSGSAHDLAVVQGRTFGGGSIADLKGYDNMVNAGIAFTKGKAKSVIPENELRKLVRDQLILEQEGGGQTIAELITKVPKKALITVMKKGFKSPVVAAKMGKFYLDGANWDSLVQFMGEKLKGEQDKFDSEDAVLEYIDDNADKLIGFATEHYNQEHPDDEPVTLENASNRFVQTQLRELVRESIMSEDKSGKGECPDTGCIKKGDGGWKIISNKTGKEWPQTYKTKEKAENALKAYHARG